MILAEISEIIKKINEKSENAYKEGIIEEETFKELKNTFEKNALKIGICGQVKTGKTTFINSYIFGKNVLPVASTPMTASLCYLTYGQSPTIEVEFFTEEEWQEIEKLSKEDDKNFNSEKIKAAKELIKNSQIIRNEIQSLLGKIKRATFDELNNYVGSEGKYTSVVKSLKISLPQEILKNIVIVDTPGTNDPVISREKRTLDFLQEADVIFLFCYSGRPFDSSDKELLRKIKNCVGRVIVIINKKDVILTEEGNEEKVINRFKEQINKLIEEIKKENGNPYVVEVLKKASEKIVLFSSIWALLGRLDEKEIRKDEDLNFYYEKFMDEYPHIKDPRSFYENSGIKDLESAIKEIIKDKEEILITKPINILISSYENKIKNKKEQRDNFEIEIKSYQFSLEEIKQEIRNLEKIKENISEIVSESIAIFEKKSNFDIKEKYKEISADLEKLYRDLEFKIPDKGLLQRHDTYQKKCEDIYDNTIYKFIPKLESILSETEKEYIGELDNSIKKIFDVIKNMGDNLLITQKDYRIILEDFMKYLNFELSEVKNISRNETFYTEGTWFTKTSIAKTTILNQISKQFFGPNGLLAKLQEILSRYQQKIIGALSNFENYMENKIINRLEEPLKRSQQFYEDKKRRTEELKKKIQDLDVEINELNKKYEFIKIEFSSFLKN